MSTNWWQAVVLGVVLIVVGLFILLNATTATVVSAIIFGAALLLAGGFEIVHAFWAESWHNTFFRMLVGLLYAIAGSVLVADPIGASGILTLVFAAVLIASGVVRVVQSFRNWQQLGWLLCTSGTVGIVAGLIILAKWPLSGLWVFGLVVGIDLILHGGWWVVIGLDARHAPRRA